MAYSVDLYINTKFNMNNIPDSPARLPEPYISKTAIDLIQNRFIDEITVKTSNFEEIRDVDYCKIGDFYYFVIGIKMLASDTVRFKLEPDYITSVGGINSIDFIDAITIRHHVSSDDFGAYCEADPMLTCNKPLKIDYNEMMYNAQEEGTTIITSTVNLAEMGQSETLPCITFTDDEDHSVSVPHLKPTVFDTRYSMGGKIDNSNPDHPVYNYDLFKINGQTAFKLDNESETQFVSRGIQYCRDLSAESAITSQYQLPATFGTVKAEAINITLPVIGEISIPANEVIQVVDGAVDNQEATNLPLIFDSTVKNKRVLYGDFCKYGLLTAAGTSAEYNPERLIASPESIEDEPNLYIAMMADPRPDGKPYFRFNFVDGKSGVSLQDPELGTYASNDSFFLNAIPGEKWYQVPLTFTAAQGSYLNEKYYLTTKDYNQYMHTKGEALGAWNMTVNTMQGAGQFLGNALPTMFTGKTSQQQIQQGLGSLGNALAGIVSYGIEKDMKQEGYDWNASKNLFEMQYQQNVVVPTVMFPYNNGSIRDFIGNGVLVYRYRPDILDLQKQDKILTMYGYKITEPLQKEFFNNRRYFNYIQLTGVSINGDFPRWVQDGIKKQLGLGIRIWHTEPSETYYNDNPII